MKLRSPSVLAWFIVGFVVLVLLMSSAPPKATYPWGRLATLPVQQGGRIKPLDSVARQSLMLFKNSQSFRWNHRTYLPTEWLMNILTQKEDTDRYEQFRIVHPTIMDMLELERKSKYLVSFNQLKVHLDEITQQADSAKELEANQRSDYQRALIQLENQVMTYVQLKHTWKPVINELSQLVYFQVLPPDASRTEWLALGQGLSNALDTHDVSPSLRVYMLIVAHYRSGDVNKLDSALLNYHHNFRQQFPALASRVQFEALFNAVEPFYKAILIYGLALLVLILSWFKWESFCLMLSVRLVGLGFGVHTLGLLSRMWIQGRPPVTNLYSSAVFVGFIGIIWAMLLEKRFKNGIGALCASVLGVLSLIIAHHLAIQGDTMEMLQAVLDTNFWLSTHVVTVTMGYSASFVAGFLGVVYVLRGVFTQRFDAKTQTSLARMIYGTVCFALLLSFVGTILGGIWADQSWGRFWGWDPKENGALLIVLWHAIILHARLGGYIQARGLAVMAVFGNVVTAFSWFGVNMLGVGLHSYGFMEHAFFWLALFIVTQIFIIYLGIIPKRYWRSIDTDATMHG